jgi:nitroimidazol reductase NimA-like FMN-containing flavoprotein (pyridoxamine 5'-phosphate oxidase superfamily)
MSDSATGNEHGSPARPEPGQDPVTSTPEAPEVLSEAESLVLVSSVGFGRLAYSGRYGLTVMPVNYKLHEGSILFRTAHNSPTDEDLRTGMPGAEYQVAFEVDHIDTDTREGWSVLIQGDAHHVDTEAERASVLAAGLESWAGGEREHFLRIFPVRITGRRLRRS